jgi:hypothetical protein
MNRKIAAHQQIFRPKAASPSCESALPFGLAVCG